MLKTIRGEKKREGGGGKARKCAKSLSWVSRIQPKNKQIALIGLAKGETCRSVFEDCLKWPLKDWERSKRETAACRVNRDSSSAGDVGL